MTHITDSRVIGNHADMGNRDDMGNRADMGEPPPAPARKSLTPREIVRAGTRRRIRRRELAAAQSAWDSEGGAAEREATA